MAEICKLRPKLTLKDGTKIQQMDFGDADSIRFEGTFDSEPPPWTGDVTLKDAVLPFKVGSRYRYKENTSAGLIVGDMECISTDNGRYSFRGIGQLRIESRKPGRPSKKIMFEELKE